QQHCPRHRRFVGGTLWSEFSPIADVGSLSFGGHRPPTTAAHPLRPLRSRQSWPAHALVAGPFGWRCRRRHVLLLSPRRVNKEKTSRERKRPVACAPGWSDQLDPSH